MASEFLSTPQIQRYYFTQYAAAARTVSDGATTNTSTTVTSNTANFSSLDVGATIAGTGIPGGATISSVTNSTTVVISAAATATASGVSLTITRTTTNALSAFQTAINADISALGGSFQVLSFTANPNQAVLVINPGLVLYVNPTDWVGYNYGTWQVVPNSKMSGNLFTPATGV